MDKRKNNDLQNITQKIIENRATRTPPKAGGELMRFGRATSSCYMILYIAQKHFVTTAV